MYSFEVGAGDALSELFKPSPIPMGEGRVRVRMNFISFPTRNAEQRRDRKFKRFLIPET